MGDILERLRNPWEIKGGIAPELSDDWQHKLRQESADEIERLRGQLDRRAFADELTAALDCEPKLERAEADIERLRHDNEVSAAAADSYMGSANNLANALERAEAEIERLRTELDACTGGPGGCGYWREAAGRARDEIERYRVGLNALRANIHACNRNPIPNSKRMEWRDMVDALLGDSEAGDG